ncbi:L-asparagine oxygenase [Paraburkholderia sp. JPY465]|uniref:hypothetical protein n=1 Tax=Paraburkholderia sp. JPY465 TaxID=3042285 RepID=UPI003D228C20
MKTVEIRAGLEGEGFVFLREWMRGTSTEDVARTLGEVTDHRLFAGLTDSAVHQLRPKPRNHLAPNRYYGHFGFGEYPPHTDLAHWIVPPRYLMLRVRSGGNQVATHIYSQAGSLSLLDPLLLGSAIFASRQASRTIVPFPMKVCKETPSSIRWDPLFIQPINDSAKACAKAINSAEFRNMRLELILEHPADTLLIDNWRTLHGRGNVTPESEGRCIDRIYLDSLHDHAG